MTLDGGEREAPDLRERAQGIGEILLEVRVHDERELLHVFVSVSESARRSAPDSSHA